MPNYKTHSIHGELLLPEMNKKIEIEREDMKIYCMGPDAMIATDYKIFDYQHANKTKDFFETLLKLIKEKKLQENKEVMAYVYGQIDHFVVDSVIHPLIYYMTEDMEAKYKMKPHGLIENWLDEYVMEKYQKKEKDYYKKQLIGDRELIELINEAYKKVYHVSYIGIKYSLGIFSTILYDSIARRESKVVPFLLEKWNVGDIQYKEDLERILPFLNIEKNTWYNPETGKPSNDSFDDLWEKSQIMSLETIENVNNYLYLDKKLTSPIIVNNISYNTGLPCENGQSYSYVKKYR